MTPEQPARHATRQEPADPGVRHDLRTNMSAGPSTLATSVEDQRTPVDSSIHSSNRSAWRSFWNSPITYALGGAVCMAGSFALDVMLKLPEGSRGSIAFAGFTIGGMIAALSIPAAASTYHVINKKGQD